MSKYLFDGKPYAGSFILESSTDGSTWEPMIAKSGNNFLGREGLVTSGVGTISSGYNSSAFSNTQFSIYKPSGSYSEPLDLSVITINSGELRQASTASCSVTISAGVGSTWTPSSNDMRDFSVHCVLANITSPYWTPGTTIFNCVVTGYDTSSGVLSFKATPDIYGLCRFIVLVRSGFGTGELKKTLRTSSDSTVEISLIPAALLVLDATDPQSYSGSGTTWIDLSGKGNNATLNGATYSASGAGGYKSILCNMTSPSKYANGTFSGTNPFNGAHSIFVWCYQTIASAYSQIVKSGSSGLMMQVHNSVDYMNAAVTLADHESLLGNVWPGTAYNSATIIALIDGSTTPIGRWICVSICNSDYKYNSRVTSYGYNNGRLFSNSGRIYDGSTTANFALENGYYIGSWFTGYVGYVAIYPAQLTLEQFVLKFNETRSKFGVASDIVLPSFTQIYNTNQVDNSKSGGLSVDWNWDTLVLAFPGDSLTEVSRSLNVLGSTTKTVSVKYSGTVVNTNSKYYGSSFRCNVAPSSAGGSIEFGNLPSNMFNSPFTVEFWFRPTAVQGGSNYLLQIGAWGTAGQLYVSLPVSSGSALLQTYIQGQTLFDPIQTRPNHGAKYLIDTWHHFALVRDSTHFRFYVNGVADFSRRIATLPDVSNIWIGGINGTPTSDFYGQIQDVRIYTSVKYNGPFNPTVVRFTWVAPTSVSNLIFVGQPTLPIGTICSITLVGTGFKPASVVVSRLTVHVFDTTPPYNKPASPNCEVTAYNISNGIITFKAVPTTTGNGRYIVVFVDPPDGSAAVVLQEMTNLTVTITPVRTITSTAGELSTRVFNGNTYTAIRNSGTLTIAGGPLIGEVLMVAGGAGSPSVGGGAPGAGGVAYSISAYIPANNYGVTIGAGGAAGATNGTPGIAGGNTIAFGITVYGGGPDQVNGGSGGGATNGSRGTALPATGTSTIGTYTSFGNRGGNLLEQGDIYGNLVYPGGGGAGGPGGDAIASVGGGVGGVGKNTWSDWLAACGIGEGDTSNKYWIGGGGGGPGNEVSGQVRAGAGGLGGGGRGGVMTVMSTNRTGPLFAGLATNGIPYSGGGGGSGIIKHSGTWNSGSEAYQWSVPSGSGGSGVIIIKQYGVPAVVPTIPSTPSDVTGLVVWLDGSDPNGNSTPPSNNFGITTWVDKSGASRSATGTGATYKAAATVGGIKNTLGTMFFSNSGYRIPYTSFPQSFTIISLFRVERALNTDGTLMSVGNDSSCYVLSGPTDCVVYFGIMSGNFQAGVGNGSNSWLAGGVAPQTPTTLIRGQWVIGTMTYDQGNKITERFINGIKMSSTTDTSVQAQWNDMYIGLPGPNGTDYRLNGYIGEILIYNKVLTNSDRQKVEGYVTNKYGFGVSV